jgi:hypothetical protein
MGDILWRQRSQRASKCRSLSPQLEPENHDTLFETEHLAYEQLSRWRAWGIFSEMEIARMMEVEETGDLMLLMLEGIHAKNQPALNKVYEKWEDEFPQGPEVARRFRMVMDKIDETFGRHIRSSAFSRKTLFHTLFTFYYDLLFGIKSPLVRTHPNDLPDDITLVVQEKSDQIIDSELTP